MRRCHLFLCRSSRAKRYSGTFSINLLKKQYLDQLLLLHKMLKVISALLFTWLCTALPLQAQQFITHKGKAHFVSDAPLELIEARSEELKGALDVSQNTFAFTIAIRSF